MLAELVLLGHYQGYLREKGLKEDQYSFEQYLADLRLGRNRSYEVWGVGVDQSIGGFEVNPLAPVEFVTTTTKVDPDGNGMATGICANEIFKIGYQQLENGGLRIIGVMEKDSGNFPEFCQNSIRFFTGTLRHLGYPISYLDGCIPTYPFDYPNTVAKMDDIWCEVGIYNDAHNPNASCLLIP